MLEVAMPVIRITDKTMSRLKEVAIPLEDTVDIVINRLLDNYSQPGERGKNSPPPESVPQPIPRTRKKKLPQKEFEIPLLETLVELGGSADVRLVKDPLYEKIHDRLLEGDHDLVSSGDPRWWNAACWARNELKVQGLLRSDSPRGVWELTGKGFEFVKSHKMRSG